MSEKVDNLNHPELKAGEMFCCNILCTGNIPEKPLKNKRIGKQAYSDLGTKILSRPVFIHRDLYYDGFSFKDFFNLIDVGYSEKINKKSKLINTLIKISPEALIEYLDHSTFFEDIFTKKVHQVNLCNDKLSEYGLSLAKFEFLVNVARRTWYDIIDIEIVPSERMNRVTFAFSVPK